MAAIVRNSILNPLATCFVPSSLKTFCEDKTTDVNADPKDLNTENSSGTRTIEKLNHKLTGMDLEQVKDKILSEKRICDKKLKIKTKDSTAMVLFGFSSIIPKSFPKATRSEPTLYEKAFSISSLILLAVSKLLHEQICGSDKSAKPSEVAAIEESKKRDEKCLCPPMFGWVVPPTLFGNPLNLKYNCCKNYAHSAQYFRDQWNTNMKSDQSMKQRKESKWGSSNISEEKETLEQCSLEFQMIIRDVCNSVRDDILLSEYENKIKDCLEVSSDKTNDKSIEPRNTVWNNALDNKILNEEYLIDDESHPLLQSLPSGNSIDENKEVGESIEAVENILGKCLMPGKESQTSDFEVPTSKTICNPPCSVWCEFLPSAAKDTFMKFLKKSQLNMDSNPKIVLQKPVVGKPVYKRSFSAGDAQIYANNHLGLIGSTLEVESRERLMLIRKDPVAYFRNNTNALNDTIRYRFLHPDLSNCQLRERCLSTQRDLPTTWGPFDGADSLWQPLPDCLPSSEYNQKNSHRKVREMRRQRSMN